MILRSTDIAGALRDRRSRLAPRRVQRGFVALPAGVGALRPGGGGATYSPWDVSSLPANVTASLSNYKLTRSGGGNSVRGVFHSVTRSTGKYAIRLLVSTVSGAGPATGIESGGGIGSYLGSSANDYSLWPNNSGTSEFLITNASSTNLGNVGAFTTDTEVMIEVDFDADKLWYGVAGTWVLSGNPAAGTNQSYTLGTGLTFRLVADMYYPGTVQLLTPPDFITPASSGFTAGWPD